MIGKESPSAEGLKSAVIEAENKYSSNDTHYLISKENLNDEYF